MAKYILLEFRDDDEAKAFIKAVRERSKIIADMFYDEPLEVDATLRAVWQKPQGWCQCVSKTGWGRTRKLGWWVCATCKLPSKAFFRGDAWHNAMGANLLPISETAPEFRGPSHQQWPGYDPDNPKSHLS